MPPNATLVSVTYNSRHRNEVELEWKVENEEGGGWTGFILQHRLVSERPGRRGSNNDSKEDAEERIGPPVWYRNLIQDPEVRSHTVGRLTPTVTYQFRVQPVNHRTLGHPSAAKTPGIVGEQIEVVCSDMGLLGEQRLGFELVFFNKNMMKKQQQQEKQ